jgi:hypothetical protein
MYLLSLLQHRSHEKFIVKKNFLALLLALILIAKKLMKLPLKQRKEMEIQRKLMMKKIKFILIL